MTRDPLPLRTPAIEAPDGDALRGVAAYVGLGANLGDRRAALETALRELHAPPTIVLERVSSVFETAPVGVVDQPDFLNAAARVRTTLSPLGLLGVLLDLENRMGRTRTVRWGPRVIDLDLLLYGGQEITQPGLDVPHPRLRERPFVLAPLADIAPDLTLPPDGKSVREVLEKLFLGLSRKSGTSAGRPSSNTEVL